MYILPFCTYTYIFSAPLVLLSNVGAVVHLLIQNGHASYYNGHAGDRGHGHGRGSGRIWIGIGEITGKGSGRRWNRMKQAIRWRTSG